MTERIISVVECFVEGGPPTNHLHGRRVQQHVYKILTRNDISLDQDDVIADADWMILRLHLYGWKMIKGRTKYAF